MNKRIIAEVVLGLGILACLIFIGVDQYHKAVVNAQAEAVAQAKQAMQKDKDDALAERDKAYQATLADYEARYQRLAKMTPQQIIQKAPEYVTLPKPIIIAGPETTTLPVSGSAIVPPEDVQPLAQSILDEAKCKVDFAKCFGDLKDWQDKYQLKSDEAAQWEKAAKGGSWLKRLGKNSMKIGIGVGIGYMLHR